MTEIQGTAERLRDLCRDFSPSIIPELRGDAAAKRAELRHVWPGYSAAPIYPYDFVCDFVEAVMALAAEGVDEDTYGFIPWWTNTNWAIYDELRNYGKPEPEPEPEGTPDDVQQLADMIETTLLGWKVNGHPEIEHTRGVPYIAKSLAYASREFWKAQNEE